MTFVTFRGFGNRLSMWPFHRAGLSPVLNSLAVAQSSTASILCLTLVAVSVFVFQIGVKQLITIRVSMTATSRVNSGIVSASSAAELADSMIPDSLIVNRNGSKKVGRLDENGSLVSYWSRREIDR